MEYEYKCPEGAYPLQDFHEICRVCTPFQFALVDEISTDLLKGLRSYWGYKLMGRAFPQIFSAPYRQTYASDPKNLRAARTCLMSSITMPSLVGLRFHLPQGRPKTMSVCLFVGQAFQHQRLCTRFHHKGVGLQKRF